MNHMTVSVAALWSVNKSFISKFGFLRTTAPNMQSQQVAKEHQGVLFRYFPQELGGGDQNRAGRRVNIGLIFSRWLETKRQTNTEVV